MGVPRTLRVRAWPLSAQVMLALAIALLPLGVLAEQVDAWIKLR